MGYLYISYDPADAVLAHQINTMLIHEGFATWIDENRLQATPEDFTPIIDDAIRACAGVLEIAPSQNSVYVPREIDLARALRKPIFPVRDISELSRIWTNITLVAQENTFGLLMPLPRPLEDEDIEGSEQAQQPQRGLVIGLGLLSLVVLAITLPLLVWISFRSIGQEQELDILLQSTQFQQTSAVESTARADVFGLTLTANGGGSLARTSVVVTPVASFTSLFGGVVQPGAIASAAVIAAGTIAPTTPAPATIAPTTPAPATLTPTDVTPTSTTPPTLEPSITATVVTILSTADALIAPAETLTSTIEPTFTASATLTPSPTLTLSPTTAATVTAAATNTPTETVTPSLTSTTINTATNSPTATLTASPTLTASNTATFTATATPTATHTATASMTPTPSATVSDTPSLTHTATATPSSTSTPTRTATPTVTASNTPTATPDLRLRADFDNRRWTPINGVRQNVPMVYVPAGCVMMREGGAGEPTEACVETFWISRTEITNAQYAACVAAGSCTAPANVGSATRSSYYDNSLFANHPVLNLTWQQAQDYAEWFGGALPGEAEWRYAAQGPSNWTYPWGTNAPNPDLANYDRIVGDTRQMGAYPRGASWVGALDMAGNVREWTASSVNTDEAVIVGGAWDSPALSVTGDAYATQPRTTTDPFTGFRVTAIDAQPTS